MSNVTESVDRSFHCKQHEREREKMRDGVRDGKKENEENTAGDGGEKTDDASE